MEGQPGDDRRCSVLIVDDDRDIRDVLSLVLSDNGYAVQQACDGRCALELLRGGAAVDVIILDLTMPGMDGWTFRAEQRADPALSQIPVLVLSAMDPAGAREALAADAYMQKPIDIVRLLRDVARLCRPPLAA